MNDLEFSIRKIDMPKDLLNGILLPFCTETFAKISYPIQF